MNLKFLFPLFLFVGMSFLFINAEEVATKAPSLSKYQAKNYEHLIGKITGLDDAQLKIHFKLYEGYVNNSNLVLEKIENLTKDGQSRSPEFAGLKRILGWEFDGMLLHELYFENLGGKDPLSANDPLNLKIQNDFGSYDQWKADFIATGLMRGIGWVVTYVDPKNGRLINTWINEHDVGHLAGGKPLLIMDVWEHAFIAQFGLDRNKYIEIFFNNIDWNVVSNRFKELPK